MAPTKKKGTPAPTSKKPVVRKDGLPTRADKKRANLGQCKAIARKIQGEIDSQAPQTVVGEKPESYTESLGERFFELVATGHSIDKITAREDMPRLGVLLRWLGDDTHPAALTYVRAKALLVPLLEERIVTAALESNPGTILTNKQVVTKDGDIVDVEETRTFDNVERSKLVIGAYQWTLSHLKPKKHGRNPDPSTGTANEQLKGLFDALKAGPVDK